MSVRRPSHERGSGSMEATVSQSVELVVQFEIIDLDVFLIAAQRCAEYVRDNEPETLAYEWYLNDEGTQGRLFEQYASSEAFRQHLGGRVFTELGHALSPAIRWKAIESFGPVPAEFHQILGRMRPENWPR